MDLNYFYTFKEVVKWGSYTKTGEQLGYAQSSVTTQIKKLEDHFQVKLFERVGRKMRLTQSGEELYYYVNQILLLMDEAEERISNEHNLRGTLRIGTVESLAAYFITPYIKELKTRHPDLKILLESGLCPKLKEGVLEGAFDLAIVLDRYIDHPELTTIPIREETLVMIAPKNHRLQQLKEMNLQELEGETLILTEEGCPYRVLLEQLLMNETIQVKSVISFSSLEAIKQCVADDLGIAILPEIAARKEIESGKVTQIPFDHEEIRIYTQIVYQNKKWLTPPLSQLITSLKDNIKKNDE
ncbi:LysR family transcriptional regulator [Priestia aryabhattai]|uniref:LysR family transcriptional regulator n=1 Tax=Bacillaceae TaxID=186817 RepID=UPI000B9FB678|nr:LysR family transcriptional regulator [Bacillus sp. CBEL-1]OZT11700.1 LysR family transcriptional regulator [Priestia aryabhattai]TDB53126.1 LysR family transcriptional regulator [Bacillus sp. CBEL-1]